MGHPLRYSFSRIRQNSGVRSKRGNNLQNVYAEDVKLLVTADSPEGESLSADHCAAAGQFIRTPRILRNTTIDDSLFQ